MSDISKLTISQKEALENANWSYGIEDGEYFARKEGHEIYGNDVFLFLEEEAEELISGSHTPLLDLKELINSYDKNYKLKSLDPLEIYYKDKHLIKGEGALFILNKSFQF